jgi:hypothetical protein
MQTCWSLYVSHTGQCNLYSFFVVTGPTKESMTLRFWRDYVSKVTMVLYITSARHRSLEYCLMEAS